jgi:hypothetical protein
MVLLHNCRVNMSNNNHHQNNHSTLDHGAGRRVSHPCPHCKKRDSAIPGSWLKLISASLFV